MHAVGRRLRGLRAGDQYRCGEDLRFAHVPRTIALQSAAFEDGEPLPDGNISPPLTWTGVPPQTRALALVVEDVDVPFPRPLAHAVAYALDPASGGVEAGGLDDARTPLGFNGFGKRAYLAPAPIPGHGVHRYVFTLLAVDFVPRFDQPPTRGRLLDAIAGHVIALAELMGTRER